MEEDAPWLQVRQRQVLGCDGDEAKEKYQRERRKL